MSEKINQDAIIQYPAKWGYVERAIDESVHRAVNNAIKVLIEAIKSEEKSVRYFTKAETAEILHVNPSTIDVYVRGGKIKPVKLGGRVLFSSLELEGLSTSGLKYKRG